MDAAPVYDKSVSLELASRQRGCAMQRNDFGLMADSNLDRLLKTIRFEKTDRVPNWELGIEARNVEHFVGKKVRSDSLPIEEMVKLALATGTDAIQAPIPTRARPLSVGWRATRY